MSEKAVIVFLRRLCDVQITELQHIQCDESLGCPRLGRTKRTLLICGKRAIQSQVLPPAKPTRNCSRLFHRHPSHRDMSPESPIRSRRSMIWIFPRQQCRPQTCGVISSPVCGFGSVLAFAKVLETHRPSLNIQQKCSLRTRPRRTDAHVGMRGAGDYCRRGTFNILISCDSMTWDQTFGTGLN